MVFVVCCLFLFLFGFSASLPVKRLLQAIPVSPFLLSHISRVDRPCPVLLGNAGEKKKEKKRKYVKNVSRMSERYATKHVRRDAGKNELVEEMSERKCQRRCQKECLTGC